MSSPESSNQVVGVVSTEVIYHRFETLLRDLDREFLGPQHTWRKDLMLERINNTKYEILRFAETDAKAALAASKARAAAPELKPLEEDSRDAYERWKQRIAEKRTLT